MADKRDRDKDTDGGQTRTDFETWLGSSPQKRSV